MLLEGKSIIVTGGNSGIGEAIVLAAAAEGANVVIDYVADPQETESLVSTVEKLGGRAVGVKADVSTLAGIQSLVDTAVSSFGQPDVLVNNAGIERRTSLLGTTEDEFDRVMNINLKSAFFGTQSAAKQFIAQKSPGLVINTSTMEDPKKLKKPNSAIPLGRMATAA